jgi:hypothetical protein
MEVHPVQGKSQADLVDRIRALGFNLHIQGLWVALHSAAHTGTA